MVWTGFRVWLHILRLLQVQATLPTERGMQRQVKTMKPTCFRILRFVPIHHLEPSLNPRKNSPDGFVHLKILLTKSRKEIDVSSPEDIRSKDGEIQFKRAFNTLYINQCYENTAGFFMLTWFDNLHFCSLLWSYWLSCLIELPVRRWRHFLDVAVKHWTTGWVGSLFPSGFP